MNSSIVLYSYFLYTSMFWNDDNGEVVFMYLLRMIDLSFQVQKLTKKTYPSLNCTLIPVIGCTTVGFRSKTTVLV